VSSGFVFDGLKMHLKARGMTYADVASSLKISEATVKRIFATRNCTLERLDSICELVQVEMAELARGTPRESRLLNQLSPGQEEELASEPALLLVAVCALQQLRVDEIVELFRLDEAQCVKLLLRLERIGFLELHENNRIRLRVARTFAWIPDGPIMRYVKAQAGDFFQHSFGAPGEVMRMISVRVSSGSQVALLRQVEQLAREYAEQHSADARLPLAQRNHVTLLIAVRSWEPAFFKALRRSG
jgi:DNA-binding Xre family transcriptional regulator